MTIEIGTGTVVSGDFNEIDWANGSYFIKSEIDPEGETDYSITGTSQLLSVPYALYADRAGHADSTQHAIYADSTNFDRSYVRLTKKATPQIIPSGSNQTITNYNEIESEDFTIDNSTGTVTFIKPELCIRTSL